MFRIKKDAVKPARSTIGEVGAVAIAPLESSLEVNVPSVFKVDPLQTSVRRLDLVVLQQFLPRWSDLKIGERLASHTHGVPLLGMLVHCTGVGAACSVLGGRGVAAEAGCALSGTGRA